jgi:hypothetical protein
MNIQTMNALEKSIEHWAANLAAKDPKDVRVGAGNCALCDLFFADLCEGCPVMQRSGEMRCIGTPYRDATTALDRWSEDLRGNFPIILGGLARSRWREAAKRELEFLRSLREIGAGGR